MSPETHVQNTKPDTSQSGFLLPAVQATFCQAVSLAIIYGFLHLAWWMAGWEATLGIAAIAQGALAAVLSYWRRLPPWWLGIQFIFPMALLMAISLGMPPSIFLLAFLLLLLVYWTPFKTRVPLYNSNRRVWERVAQLLSRKQDVRFLDIGSGLGGLVIHLAKHCPGASIVGVELAPLPWLFSYAAQQLYYFAPGENLVRAQILDANIANDVHGKFGKGYGRVLGGKEVILALSI